MKALIKLFVDDSGRILKEVIVCGPSIPFPEPQFEVGEINIDIDGDDTASTNLILFLAHKINKGDIAFWKLADNPKATE